jgi:hypothetical protein
MPRSVHRAALPRLLALAAAAALAPLPAGAQSAMGLPPAKEILDRYARAVGADAWRAHTSSRMKATTSVAGMTMTTEVVHIFPHIWLHKLAVPGMGELRSGFDGTTVWSVDPMQGPRIVTGAEAEALKDDSDPANAGRSSANIVSSETVEKTTVNGKECYRVKHVWKSGRESNDCFGIADGFMVSTTSKQVSSMGEIEVTQLHGEYKDFGGMKRPVTITSQMMGQPVTITMVSWEWDNVEAKETALPPEIKALVEKKP